LNQKVFLLALNSLSYNLSKKKDGFIIGDTLYALNLKYSDGTRLRAQAVDDSKFLDIIVLNDSIVKIKDIKGEFAMIAKQNGDFGWIRRKNLCRNKRVPGLDKSLVKNEIVTPDAEYVRGIKLYGIGIKADPGASKFGKGEYHLISPIWLNDLTEFAAKNQSQIKIFVKNASGLSQKNAFEYLLDCSHYLFNRSLMYGFKDDLENLKMATFLIMSAAEIDDFPFGKYNEEERKKYREAFYSYWLSDQPDQKLEVLETSHKFPVPQLKFNLLPYVAMERFGINSSLSGLKYEDPLQELREGFKLSKRVDSLIRHFTSVHLGMRDEDHIIHALWNFHAIYHNLILFPDKNDLVNFSLKNAIEYKKYDPTTSLDLIDSKEKSKPISEVLKYDWNEGVIPPPASVVQALQKFISTVDRLKWYPHLSGGHFLKKKLIEYASRVTEEPPTEKNLIITNGSDDALILICHKYLNSNKKALIPLPTYEHFVLNAEATGGKVTKYFQKNIFENNMTEIISQLDYNTPDLVYLVSPNNPSGTVWQPKEIESLLKSYPNVVFILDEAYFEFGDGSSCLSLILKYQNIIVTRTASKAFCLASIRCGYLFAHEKIIEGLLVIYNPKSVNEFAQIAFSEALDSFESYYKPYIQAINESRGKFIKDLRDGGIEVYTGGYGNFVCVKIPKNVNPSEVCEKLKEKSIYVRDISARLPEFIRITIGLDMVRVVNALLEILKK